MVRIAPRIVPRLVRTLGRLDDGKIPIAEVCRRVGREAEAAGLTQPSYEAVRGLVHRLRSGRRPRSRLSGPEVLAHVGGAMRGYSVTLALVRLPQEEHAYPQRK
jgi:hypothetical protein